VKKTKGCQLRVRISEDARFRLEQIAKERGREESLSDLVRDGVDQILESPEGILLELQSQTWKLLHSLAKETDRPLSQIVDECVEGVFNLLQEGESPLIIEEIKLRRRYASKPANQKASDEEPVGRIASKLSSKLISRNR
jgi:predicted DNA-binding protein